MIQRLSFLLMATAALLSAQSSGPATFTTPDEAKEALIQAASKGMDAVRAFFGPGAGDIARTGDEVQDKTVLERFKSLAAEKAVCEPDPMNPDRMSLLLGPDGWPFAVPLVRQNGRWLFDIKEGKAEIRRRTIGGNELDAIDICRGYVEAQELFAQTDWSGKGTPQYASKIISTEGKKDGLYWPGEDSPVAAPFAKAFAQGYTFTSGQPRPYHGYYFKILLSQGPAAEGGELDYVVHGLMIGGFALVAWPAEYGVSGIKTFIVNQSGAVYEKDLGPTSGTAGKAMTRFNPDKTWDLVPETED